MRTILSILILFGLLSQSTIPLLAQSGGSTVFLPLVTTGGQPTSMPATPVEEINPNDIQQDDHKPAVIDIQTNSLPSGADIQRDSAQNRTMPTSFSSLQLTNPVMMAAAQATQAKLLGNLATAIGPHQVIVRLSEMPLANVEVTASAVEARQAQLARLQGQQVSIIQQAQSLDSQTKLLGNVQTLLNAVMLEIDGQAMRTLAADPTILSIAAIADYELDLDESVPYIGATAAQASGFTGAGVRVAVLDSGIDYTHAHLGGSGNPVDFTSNNPAIVEPGSFPTAKVVGGYDFVGASWSGTAGATALVPDPDPLDAGPSRGHGTHVAAIIGGLHGVAPGVQLYALKVCSSISSACSGVALLRAMEYAVDPNGDHNFDDAVDIINLSLGAAYGSPFDDDLSLAVENASKLGVLTVASAGNSGDKPYANGTPATTPAALAVAQTQAPSTFQPLMEIITGADVIRSYAVGYQTWSAPFSTLIEAPVQYGDGAGANLNGCAPFAPNALSGKIILLDRNACQVSLKLKNISEGGALAGLIGATTSGDTGSNDGGHRPITVPGFVITLADANLIKQAIATSVKVRFDPAQNIALVGHMAPSSSRGPSLGDNRIKPDIGAPGALVSALAGSGTETSVFGGTSGAAPMVAGAAALVMQANPMHSATEVKAVLMNTAETQIMDHPIVFGGDLAPITRIGSGEVRVQAAIAAPAAAWDAETGNGSLSFGFHDVTGHNINGQEPAGADNLYVMTRTVTLRNYAERELRYEIQNEFRFANDKQNGAVRLVVPDAVIVAAHNDIQFPVRMEIDGRLLNTWALNSGQFGGDGDALTIFEYDGYLRLTEAGAVNNTLHLAWHVLPRKAGDITLKTVEDELRIRNRGVAPTTVSSFSLLAVSDNQPEGAQGAQNPTPDFRYLGYATYRAAADVCGQAESFVLAFAINTWERQSHAAAPVSFEIWLDTNQDNTSDYKLMTRDVSFSNISDGRNLTWAINLSSSDTSAYFYTQHATNSANTVMMVCAEQIGLTLVDRFKPINLTAVANDTYYDGAADTIQTLTIAPFGEQYLGIFQQNNQTGTTLFENTNDTLQVLDFGPLYNTSEQGILLFFSNGAPAGYEAGTVRVSE